MVLRSCHELPVKGLHDNIDLILHNSIRGLTSLNVKRTDLMEDSEGANGIVLCEPHPLNEGTISISVRRQPKNRFQSPCGVQDLEMQMMVIIVSWPGGASCPLDNLPHMSTG